MPYFEAIFYKNREMSLSSILSLFLFSGNFEPRYSYKRYSYKENSVFLHQILTFSELQLSGAVDSSLW